MRSLAGLVLVAVAVGSSEAAVFCAKPSRDGTLDGSVKVRGACKRNEVQLAPGDVGFCCGTPTTVTTTSSCPTFTTTTLGVPDCGGSGGACAGLCANGRACVADPEGVCGCTGAELPCGVVSTAGSMWRDVPYRLHLCALQRGAAERLSGSTALRLRARAVRPMGRVVQHGPSRLRRGAVLRRFLLWACQRRLRHRRVQWRDMHPELRLSGGRLRRRHMLRHERRPLRARVLSRLRVSRPPAPPVRRAHLLQITWYGVLGRSSVLQPVL
jgi:hypothetical protein